MQTSDFTKKLTAAKLNENMFKKFGVRINFDKYDREQLENYRNLIRTEIHQAEASSNFNDLLTNETYQKNKFIVSVLNTKIKEMLGESLLNEKAVSVKQQQAAGAALAAKRKGSTKGLKGASKEMAKMSTKELEKFAGTKHKGLPAKKTNEATKAKKDYDGDGKVESPKDEVWGSRAKAAAKAGKPFKEDMKVGDTKQTRTGVMTKTATGVTHKRTDYKDDEHGEVNKTHAKSKSAAEKKTQAPAQKQSKTGTWGMKDGAKFDNRNKKVKEGAKPDFLDMDKDGDKKEPMKKAVADKKKKKMEESRVIFRRHVAIVNESLAALLAEDEEGKAKAITAASDIVNDYTTWMQRVGQYQTKSMIELADAIRADFGQAEADAFKAAVGPALASTLETLTAQREAISHAVAVLAGEASGAEPMGMDGMEPDVSAAPADDMNTAPADDFSASDAAAGGPETSGREVRESREQERQRRLAESHSLMKILSK